MRHRLFLLVAFLCIAPATFSQTAALKEIHAEGLKTLSEPQLVQLTGLTIDSQVGRADLQGAADILLRSGMFAKVNYSFATRNDAVIVTFKVEENPRLKVSYDNFPCGFPDSGNQRRDSQGPAVLRRHVAGRRNGCRYCCQLDCGAFLASKAIWSQHSRSGDAIVNPLADGSLLQFHAEGVAPKIAGIEFSDPNLKDNRAVLQHLPEIQGKPYSRMAIDTWLPFSDSGLWDLLAFGPNGQFGFLKFHNGIAQAFAKDQFGLPVFAKPHFCTAVLIIFVIALFYYRQRGPVLILLCLFTGISGLVGPLALV